MRTLKLLLLGLILLAVVVLAVANREAVTLHLLPQGLDRVMPLSIELPLFVVILVVGRRRHGARLPARVAARAQAPAARRAEGAARPRG